MRDVLVARADTRSVPIRSETVDLIVTSPPYFAQRTYEGGEGQIGNEPSPEHFLDALWAVTTEWWRVLKPSGVLFVNLGDKRGGQGPLDGTVGLADGERFQPGARDGHRRSRPAAYEGIRPKSKMLLPHRYAIGCADGLADPDGQGWIIRQDMVWLKPNGMPEPATDRTRDSHEYWFMLTKQADYYVYPEALDGRRHSVWDINLDPYRPPGWVDIIHPAAFPPEWPRRLISAFCPPDGTVLDPMGGIGTTAMVARTLGRRAVTLDLSAAYCKVAADRIMDSYETGRIASRTFADQQQQLY